ncbi:MAG: universal stress protein [Cyclobacteriaceae bacterium]
MLRLKKILVCLDLTAMDENVIKYAGLMATTMQSESVVFMHINEPLDVPASVRKNFPELYGAPEGDFKDKMLNSVKQYFPGHANHNSEFVINEGSPSQQILRWPGMNDVDLIIMGKKSHLKGKGVNPSKIANVSHCSVLFVPEKCEISIDKLFVPIDFSLRSKTAIDQALEIRRNGKSEITLQHVYYVPQGYHYTGKTYEEFTTIMRENSEKAYFQFLKQNGYDASAFKDVYTLDDDDAPADKIYLEALRQNANLIILASRGRTKAASLLLGSVALELIKYDQRIPYMVIKDKRENMSFFAALMKV